MIGMGPTGFLALLVGGVKNNPELVMLGAGMMGLPALIREPQLPAHERIPTTDLRQHAKTH